MFATSWKLILIFLNNVLDFIAFEYADSYSYSFLSFVHEIHHHESKGLHPRWAKGAQLHFYRVSPFGIDKKPMNRKIGS